MQDYVQRYHSNISDGDLESTLPQNSERAFTVAKCIGTHWKTIRMHLGLTEEDAVTIEAESGTKHKAYRMLVLWRQRREEAAKLRVLLNACYEADNKGAIDSICERRDTIFGVSSSLFYHDTPGDSSAQNSTLQGIFMNSQHTHSYVEDGS